MRGGKRAGAGRKPGPKKVKAQPLVLPSTLAAWTAVAFKKGETLGEVLDRKFAKKSVEKSTSSK
jgi:hypothetical protein